MARGHISLRLDRPMNGVLPLCVCVCVCVYVCVRVYMCVCKFYFLVLTELPAMAK
jgi:hypothetical protein